MTVDEMATVKATQAAETPQTLERDPTELPPILRGHVTSEVEEQVRH